MYAHNHKFMANDPWCRFEEGGIRWRILTHLNSSECSHTITTAYEYVIKETHTHAHIYTHTKPKTHIEWISGSRKSGMGQNLQQNNKNRKPETKQKYTEFACLTSSLPFTTSPSHPLSHRATDPLRHNNQQCECVARWLLFCCYLEIPFVEIIIKMFSG